MFKCTRQHLLGLIGCCISHVNCARHSAPAAVLWRSDMTSNLRRVMTLICETVCEKEKHCKVCLFRATPLPVGAAESCTNDTPLCYFCLLRIADIKGHVGAHEVSRQHSLLVCIISFQLLLQCEYLLVPLIQAPCQGNHDVSLLQQQLLIPVHLQTHSDVSHGSCMWSIAVTSNHHGAKVDALC